jgi:hypothetical protein
MSWIVVDQHAAHVEDRDGGAGRGAFWGQNRAFPTVNFRANLANKIKSLKTSRQSVFCWSFRSGLLGCGPLLPNPRRTPEKREKPGPL